MYGYANNSNINNITNQATQVIGKTVYEENGYYCSSESYGTKNELWQINESCSIGGIAGKIENTNIKNCNNNANVTINCQQGTFIGGITRIC